MPAMLFYSKLKFYRDYGRNSKETTLARYFIKAITRPSFTQLRVIRQINKKLNIKVENVFQRCYIHMLQLCLLI